MTVVGKTGMSEPVAPRPRRNQVRISFSGLDGAGKTRQIDALVAALQREHSVEVLWVPVKIWPESLLNRLPAGFRSRMGPGRQVPADASASADPDPGLNPERALGTTRERRTRASFLWWAVATFAAVTCGLSLRRRASASTADVVVLDRYRLDTVVKLQFWYSEVSGRWLSRIVSFLAPAPDVELLLRVAPEVAYARKPEQWSIAQLSRQARLYDVLAGAEPGRVAVIDAQDDPHSIADKVAAEVGMALGGG